jgi:argininosuccinate lyase
MLDGIQELEDAVKDGRFAPVPGDEDVHTALERGLMEALGPLGGKLRAGRSRNDQAVNDLRLYLRDAARGLAHGICDLLSALIGQAGRHVHTVAPGFTHLQPAQPVSFAHQLAAHAQALARDLSRLRDWDGRYSFSPLGSAALAGSTIAVHPELSAEELGYGAACPNSMDAVGDRDYVVEFGTVTALCGAHLSRLSEEICLWTSRQFRWVELDDAYATGSSIMPQKKNPDIAELTRGVSAVLIGNATALLTLVKGLPLAYNRDLSWDKPLIFESIDDLLLVLPAMAGMVRTMRVDEEALAAAAVEGFTLATDVADWLARRTVPFNEAHEIVGRLVRLCEERACDLGDLSDDDLMGVDARLTPDVRSVLDARSALDARCGAGGTAPARVTEQLRDLEACAAAAAAWARGETP